MFDHRLKARPERPLLFFATGLVTGTYTVEASTRSGLKGRVTFDVLDLAPGRAEIHLPLR